MNDIRAWWHTSPDALRALLDRYLSGTASTADEAAVREWLTEAKVSAVDIEYLESSRARLAQGVASVNVDQLIDTLAARRAGQMLPRPATRSALWPAVRIAAAILVVVGSAWTALHFSLGSLARPARDYATATGERTTVHLSDGTQVTLGPESHLQVAASYGRTMRTVSLQGEAYFVVVHNTVHPFAVLADNMHVTDVGTEFDVRAYDDNEVRVAVARGNVLVGAGRGNGAIGYLRPSMNSGTVSRPRPPAPPNDPTFFQYIPTRSSNAPPFFQDIPLSAGDMINIVDGNPTITHHADIASATAWVQGQLVFDNVPLRDVARELTRTFGVTVTVADSGLSRALVTGNFAQRGVDEILWEVTTAIGARYERQGQAVVIRPGTANHGTPARPGAPIAPQKLVQGGHV